MTLQTLTVSFLGCFITILGGWEDLLHEYVNTNAYVHRHHLTSLESTGWYTALRMQHLGPGGQEQERTSVISKLHLLKGEKDSIRTPILCPPDSLSLPNQSSREIVKSILRWIPEQKQPHLWLSSSDMDQGQEKTHMDKLPLLRWQSLDNPVP